MQPIFEILLIFCFVPGVSSTDSNNTIIAVFRYFSVKHYWTSHVQSRSRNFSLLVDCRTLIQHIVNNMHQLSLGYMQKFMWCNVKWFNDYGLITWLDVNFADKKLGRRENEQVSTEKKNVNVGFQLHCYEHNFNCMVNRLMNIIDSNKLFGFIHAPFSLTFFFFPFLHW